MKQTGINAGKDVLDVTITKDSTFWDATLVRALLCSWLSWLWLK